MASWQNSVDFGAYLERNILQKTVVKLARNRRGANVTMNFLAPTLL